MSDFKNLSDRLMSKVTSFLKAKEGVDTISSQNELTNEVTTTTVKDAFGHLYEIRVTLVGRTKLDRKSISLGAYND